MLFRRITGAVENSDGATEGISLDAPLPALIAPEDVDRISFLRLARLDSDKLTVAWSSIKTARSQFRTFDLVKS